MRSVSADLIRIIAVILVILFHLNITYFGWIGVDLFLFLSGYFAKVSLEKYGPIKFLYMRAKRISPPFISTLMLVLICSYILLPTLFIQENMLYFVAPMFHVFNALLFVKEVDYFNSINWALPTFHFWSLSFEVQLYVLVATIYSILPKQSHWRLNTTFAIFILVFFLNFRDIQIYSDYFNPLLRVFMFVVGYFYAQLKFSIVMAAVVCYATILGDAIYFVLLSLIFAINISLCNNLSQKSKSIIGWFAHYSYEIYLVHWPIICFISWYK